MPILHHHCWLDHSTVPVLPISSSAFRSIRGQDYKQTHCGWVSCNVSIVVVIDMWNLGKALNLCGIPLYLCHSLDLKENSTIVCA